MSNRTSDQENGPKSPSQDILGLVLFGLFGFVAVSIFLHLRGQVSSNPLTLPVELLINAVGPFAGLFLSLGFAALGLVLFVRRDALPCARHASGVGLMALGTSLLVGGVFPHLGGILGGFLPGALGVTAGLIAGLVAGLSLLLATAWAIWLGAVDVAGPKPLGPSALVPPRRADSDGVSAAEAMALQPERPSEAHSEQPPEPADVRVGGGIPAGAVALPTSDELGTSDSTRSGPNLGGSIGDPARADALAGDPVDTDLAPSWSDPEPPAEAGGATRDTFVDDLEAAAGVGKVEDVPAPSWEFEGLLDRRAEDESAPVEALEEEDYGDEAEAAELEEEEDPELVEAAELEEGDEEEEYEEEEEDPELEEAAELEEEDEEEEYEEEEEEDPELVEAAELEEEDEEEEYEEEEEKDPELVEAAELEEPAPAEETLEPAAGVPPPAWEQAGLFDEAASTASEQEHVLTPAPAPEAEVPAEAVVEMRPESLIFQAGLLFLEENRVAVSMLQRRFTLDFDQACEVLDKLQQLGLIGPYVGGRNREILMTAEEWALLEADVVAAS